MGVDVGTSGLKVMICDVEGQIVGSHSTNYEAEHLMPGWAEQNPLIWEDASLNQLHP